MSLRMQSLTLKEIYPQLNSIKEAEEKKILKENEEHPFVPALEYCRTLPENTKKERKLKQEVLSCYPNCCFNHRVGMPKITYEDPIKQIQWESDPIEFSAYEEEMVQEYESTHFFAENKCRGAGASERITVRHMLYKYAVENKTPERKCLICGSISITISKNFTHRIKLLADKVPFLYKDGQIPNSDFPREIYFRDGQVIAIPAEEDAFRSYDKVGDVILEEVSSWNKEDDEPVLKAAEPHVFKSNAKVANLTTPKGMVGYYWNKIFTDDPDVKTKYKKHVTNWRRVVGVPDPNVLPLDENGKEISSAGETFEEYWIGKDQDELFKNESYCCYWIGKPQKEIEKYYRNKYAKDIKYKIWFDAFFKVTIDQFFDFVEAIISLKEIARLYIEDRDTYDQEADNKFLITGSVAFGGNFREIDLPPTNFAAMLDKHEEESEEETDSDDEDDTGEFDF